MSRGRPKGSKNKPKNEKTNIPIIKRGRGRPKGSKGKPKEIKKTSLEIKRIKREIKDLRAEKLCLPSGNEKRIELHRKIKEMKLLLMNKKENKILKENLYSNPRRRFLYTTI